jgi:hypothetical protein
MGNRFRHHTVLIVPRAVYVGCRRLKSCIPTFYKVYRGYGAASSIACSQSLCRYDNNYLMCVVVRIEYFVKWLDTLA